MKFPETPREGSEAHQSALQRLDVARRERRRRRHAYEGAKGEPARKSAAAGLSAANEQLAAREAWVLWVERGY
jgi:hypothetical protein